MFFGGSFSVKDKKAGGNLQFKIQIFGKMRKDWLANRRSRQFSNLIACMYLLYYPHDSNVHLQSCRDYISLTTSLYRGYVGMLTAEHLTIFGHLSFFLKYLSSFHSFYTEEGSCFLSRFYLGLKGKHFHIFLKV